MTTRLLIDNDIVIKLACMDVYVEGLNAIGYAPVSVGSLTVMLRFMGLFEEARRRRVTHSQAEADRLLVALQSITQIEPTEEEAKVIASVSKIALMNDLDLQEGELMLLVIAVSRGNLRIATGDKRALRSLRAMEDLWADISQLRGQFYCLELIFSRLCSTLGFARVRQAVTTSPRADETIAYVYDQTQTAAQNGFIAGLGMVIREHIEHPAPGWLV